MLSFFILIRLNHSVYLKKIKNVGSHYYTNVLRLLKSSCQMCHYRLNNVILLYTRREFIINTMKTTTYANTRHFYFNVVNIL